MPQVVAEKGVRVTIGAVCANQRWQIVIPLLSSAPLVPKVSGLQVGTLIESTFIPAWQQCFAADCYVDGYTVEGMCPGVIIPIRHVFGPATWPGLQGSESYSPNASMLAVFYSSEQAVVPGNKTHVAKQFLGPPPESKCAADSLDLSFVASEVQALADAILTWTVGGGGPTFTRALSTDNAPAVDIWECDVARVRSTIFTQRNRVRPVL